MMIVQSLLSLAQPKKLIREKGFLIILRDQREVRKIVFTDPLLWLDLTESPFSEQRCPCGKLGSRFRETLLHAVCLYDFGHDTYSAGFWKAQLSIRATEAFASLALPGLFHKSQPSNRLL